MKREEIMALLDAGADEAQRCYIEDVGFRSNAMVHPMWWHETKERIVVNKGGDHVSTAFYVFFSEYDALNDKYSSFLTEFPDIPIHIGSEDLSRILDYSKDTTLYLEIQS